MAFSGVAVYNIYSNEIGEDVSQIVSMISPKTAGFLDDMGDADLPVESKYYSWEEKSLLPDTYAGSTNVASTAAATGITIQGTDGQYLRAQDILMVTATQEQLLVTSVGTSAATIYVSRGYAGTSANSYAAASTLEFLGSALEEGAGIRTERRVGHVLKGNYVQTFREDIKSSNLAINAKLKVAGYPDPFQEDKNDKVIDTLKQLERAVILGRTNGNTIGASDKETTMAGIYHSIATNITSHATFTNSILNTMLNQINNYTDLAQNSDKYGLYAATDVYRKISNSRDSRIEQSIMETEVGVRPAETYLSDFGPMPIKAIRWIPAGTVLAIRKDYVQIAPFAGNSFAFGEYNNGELARTGFIAGTYGLKFMQEKAHGMLRGLA